MKSFISGPALKALILLLALLFLARTGRATTARLLTDEQLITNSRVIMLGDIRSIKAQWDAARETIYSYIKVEVSKTLKGQFQSDRIVFKQLGGTVGDDSMVIFGAPDYKVGQRVLLFLDTASDGTLRVAHLFQGKYDVVTADGTQQIRVEREIDRGSIRLLGLPDSPEITNSATLTRFTKKIKRVLGQQASEVAALEAMQEDVPIVETPPEYVDEPDTGANDEVNPQYVLFGHRWFEPDSNQPVVYRLNSAGAPTAGGSVNEINQGLAGWTNIQTTALVLQNGGSTTQFGFRADGTSAISFNDPLDQMSDPVGCGGTLAIGGYSNAGGPTRIINGQSFGRILEGDVVFNRNFGCFLGIPANLAEVTCHEVGHSIGFNHSADSSAIMYGTAHGSGRGATPSADDIAAVSFMYPGSKSGPPPPPPGPVAPIAPSNLIATAASSNTINLSWSDNSTNEQGFKLERKINVGGVYSQVALLPAGQIVYSDTGLQPSATYFYRIKAYNSAGDSGASNETQASTPAAINPNDAAFVAQSVPATMTAGQAATVSITMRNTGGTTWVAGSYWLGSQNPQDNAVWGLNRVSLPASVAPGSNATFTFNVTAPASAGSYNFQWRMLQDGAGYFGSASANVAVSVTGGGGGGGGGSSFNAAMVSQSVPATMSPGLSYVVSVTMRNTGTSSWSTSGFRLGSQNPQDNTNWGLSSVTLSKFVGPGSQFTFTFSVRAPSTPGTYNFQWRMAKSDIGYFGAASQNVAIQVGGGGGGGGTNDAAFVSQNVPASMTAGQSANVSITMRNSGTTTWAAGSYWLGSQNPQDNAVWGLNRVSLPASVAPGSNATFTFSVTAPASAGSYNFQWRMLQDGVSYFGVASSNVAITVSSAGGGGANGSSFISQSVPASMTTGQGYPVSITMRNTGTTTWAAGTYKLESQNPQGNLTWGVNQLSLPVSIAPGSDATFTFNVTAPALAGTYNFQWRMRQDGVGSFGAFSTNVAVSVTSSGGPPTVPLAIATQSIAAGQRNVAYNQQISATGGLPAYLWSITSGGLPAGLAINSSTGLISGTPSIGGSFFFTVTVRDQGGASASKSYKMFVQ